MSRREERKKITRSIVRSSVILIVVIISLAIIYRFNILTKSEIVNKVPVTAIELGTNKAVTEELEVFKDENGQYIILPDKISGFYVENYHVKEEDYLKLDDSKNQDNSNTNTASNDTNNLNSLNTAFHVDEVLGIHRVSWEDIIKPDATISSDESGVSTGVIKLEDRLVVILDFEKIVTDINPETGLKVSEMDEYETKDRSKSPIMLCEDSPLLSKLIVECLKKAGYTNLIVNMNGQEGWDKLVELHKAGTVLDDVHLIITDIEMPLMDGHRLCKLVKENETLKNIPVISFSSLINDEIRRKGESLGADAQLTKPEIGKLISVVDELVAKYEEARRGK